MIRTPLQLQLLLHCHCVAEPHPLMGNAVWDEARDYLINTQMIAVVKKDRHLSQYVFRTTKKGEFFVNHLLSVPFPEEKSIFYIPEQQKVAE